MTRKFVTFLMVALVVFASTSVLMPSAQAQSRNGGGLLIPFTQAVSGGTGQFLNAASITGTFNLQQVQVVNGALQAVGTVTGNVLDAAGNVLGTFTVGNATAPLSATGSCNILTLDIGAIHLNLLGLVVDLSPIHLNITAQAGPGNLLGNLLCAVANLLNNNGPLTGIAHLLNQILQLL
jgi:hypothetical protein